MLISIHGAAFAYSIEPNASPAKARLFHIILFSDSIKYLVYPNTDKPPITSLIVSRLLRATAIPSDDNQFIIAMEPNNPA